MTLITIAVDAMGGDHGLDVTIPAAKRALDAHENLHLILVGDQNTINLNNVNHPRIEIQHASEVVAMDEPPSQALRTKKDSSMRVAINLVKEGRAQAAVSAGNTGALMATARFVLKTLPGIDRPAIMAALPTHDSEKDVWVLDLGANVDSAPEHLYQFAVMGSIVAREVDDIKKPRVGLLNIGEEEIKGNEQVKLATDLLQQSEAINFVGSVEGNAVFQGVADVVVCDGFVGNVALKTCEGIVKLITAYAKEEFTSTLWSKFTALLARPVIKRLARRLDPARRNGASLLGLQGIVIKSHGSAQVSAFAHAIDTAVLEIEKNIPERISQEVANVLED